MKVCIVYLLILSIFLASCSHVQTENAMKQQTIEAESATEKQQALESEPETVNQQTEESEPNTANQQTVESEPDIEPEREDIKEEEKVEEESTSVDKNEFAIIHRPDELEMLLGNLEGQLREICTSNQVTITRDIPADELVLDSYNGIIIDNAHELSPEEYLHIIEIKSADASGEKTVRSSRIKLYYKLKENNEPDVFYLGMATERYFNVLYDEIEVYEETEQCFDKMRDYLADIYFKELAKYFSLPELDFNSPIHLYSNGKIERLFVEGGGYESSYYIYKQN